MQAEEEQEYVFWAYFWTEKMETGPLGGVNKHDTTLFWGFKQFLNRPSLPSMTGLDTGVFQLIGPKIEY